MKYAFAFFVWLGTLSLSAQQTFTDRLQQVVESAGRIILHQEKSITDLVNGLTGKPSQGSDKPSRRGQIDSTGLQNSDTMAVDSLLLGQKVKINGYRIQVYFGDNSRKGKTDYRNSRAYDHGGHQLAKPVNTDNAYKRGYHHINKSCGYRTYDYAQHTKLHSRGTRKRGGHRAYKSKGRTQKYRAFLLGERKIHKCAHTCAEHCGGGGKSVADYHGNSDRCRQYRQHLLKGKNDYLPCFRLSFNIIDKLHYTSLRLSSNYHIHRFILAYFGKNVNNNKIFQLILVYY
jgi:hypothetical protein